MGGCGWGSHQSLDMSHASSDLGILRASSTLSRPAVSERRGTKSKARPLARTEPTRCSPTIFTIPKPFAGHIGVIQRNAIQSWLRLTPQPQVILCGNEAGVAEVAEELGVLHIGELARNEFGTPFLHNALDQVRRASTREWLCYINTDIILLDDFTTALGKVETERFLLVGRRLDLDVTEPIDFTCRDWSATLRQRANQHGNLHSAWGIDYFVFPRNGVIDRLPPFVVGRPGWDNWMIYNARRRGVPVIDATDSIVAIHQNHDYAHVPMRNGEKWVGPEARRQIQLLHDLMDGQTIRFAIVDATHALTSQGVVRLLSPRSIRRRWDTVPVLHPRWRTFTMPLSPLVKAADWAWQRLHRNEAAST